MPVILIVELMQLFASVPRGRPWHVLAAILLMRRALALQVALSFYESR